MEMGRTAEPESRITTSHPFSTTLGMRAPESLAGHARWHGTCSRAAVCEDEALKEKGWPR